jgi:ABC-2 type transport system ATP-binding protein
MMDDVIRVKNLIKTYADTQALKGIHFQVKKGEIFGFLGPSGSGKTTTIKILTAQLQSTSGGVEVFGNNLFTQQPQSYM